MDDALPTDCLCPPASRSFVSRRPPVSQQCLNLLPSPVFSPAMRGRFSRKLAVLAKAGCLFWLLWLAYLLLEHAGVPAAYRQDQEREGHSGLKARHQGQEDPPDDQLARPLYVKPAADASMPGEWGRAAHLTLSPEEKKLEQDSLERYAINIFVSDKISLHRHIQDNRMSE